MNKNNMTQIKEALTMPSTMADALAESCPSRGEHSCRNHLFPLRALSSGRRIHSARYRRLCAAAAALLCIFAVGSTSLAYNVYQEKQLAVFMEPDLSQAKIDYIGRKIAEIGGISSCQYISGDRAWEEFKAAYFTDENGREMTELTGGFKENPLADSFNYRVSVRLNADTQTVREQIGRLPGVRKITTVREAEENTDAPK